MSDIFINSLLIAVFSALGICMGMYIEKLRTRVQQEGLHERNRQMQLQFDEFKIQTQNEITNQQQGFEQQVKGLEVQLDKTVQEREEIRREKDFLNIELARKNSEFQNLQKQQLAQDETLQKQQEQLRKDFELLANKILEEKSSKFTEQNKENIKNILHPLQEKIQHFEKKVEDSQKENISIHSALREKLVELSKANKVVGVTMTIFFSKALLYKLFSLLTAMANAGSIGMNMRTKSGLSISYKSSYFLADNCAICRLIERRCSFR